MQPFLLQPVFKDYLWGGTRLKEAFNKNSPLPIVAESWELSAHADGSSVVASGPCKGITFTELLRQNPQICGTACEGQAEFPILIKLIDAQKSLSIQVHPDDAYARRVEHEPGKTEMWMVLDARPGAFIYLGFTQTITKEEMRQHIQNNTLTEVLHQLPVEKGDVIYIPSGTIHAIGEGIVLAEVQQSSNSTYRVYDFARRGPDGKLRELHVEKALDVTTLAPANPAAPGAGPAQPVPGGTMQPLAATPYFTASRLMLAGSHTQPENSRSFVCVLCTEGQASLQCNGESLPLVKGSTAFVPASSPAFALEGQGEFYLAEAGI